jgi:hypothetical protein
VPAEPVAVLGKSSGSPSDPSVPPSVRTASSGRNMQIRKNGKAIPAKKFVDRSADILNVR